MFHKRRSSSQSAVPSTTLSASRPLAERPRRLCRAIAFGLGMAAVDAGLAQDVHLSALGNRGFQISGGNAGDASGETVAGLGDINGDGLDDVLVGAPDTDPPGRTDAGEAHVVFGKSDLTPIRLSALGGAGFTIRGANMGDLAGLDVADAGDVNGDGLDDVIIGAHLAAPGGRNQAGAAYVVFGKTGTQTVDLASLGSAGFVMNGGAPYDYAGYDVAGGIDVNGDGLDDVLVGAYGADSYGNNRAGRTFVVFGKTDTTPVEFSNLGSAGFFINGETQNDFVGKEIAGVKDVNGDGRDDILLGIPLGTPGGRGGAGEAYLVFGKTGIGPINLCTLGGGGFLINGPAGYSYAGTAVADAGDVNGDGLGDIVIGAPRADPGGVNRAGESYVVFGSTNPGTVESTNLGSAGFRISGALAQDQAGQRLAGGGDVNGDGLDDLIVGAPGATVAGTTFGKSFVVFGRTGTAPVELSALGGDGYMVTGANQFDYSGRVGGGSDVNGDGLDDLVIGSPGADPDGNSGAGNTHVVFGVPGNQAVPAPPGLAAGDELGAAVAADGSRFAVGIPNGGAGDSGQVAVYRMEGGSPILEEVIPAPAAMAGAFGGAIAMDSGRLLVGAGEQAMSAAKQGSSLQAALFERVNQQWTMVKELSSPAGSGDGFGAAVAMDGDMLLIGAPADQGGDGAAYLASANSDAMFMFMPPAGGAGGFGSALAIKGSMAGVGAPNSQIGNATVGSMTIIDQITQNLDSARVRELVQGSESQDDAQFGSAVAIGGDQFFVGAPGENEGAVYAFNAGGAQVQRASPTGLASGARFGAALDAAGDVVGVGVPGLTGGGGLAVLDGQLSTILNLGAAPGQSGYGSGVAVSNAGSVFVGAPETQASAGEVSLIRLDRQAVHADGFE